MSLELLPEYIDKIEELLVNELPLNELAVEIEQTLLAEHVAILLEAFPIKSRLCLWVLFTSDYQQDIFLETVNVYIHFVLNMFGMVVFYILSLFLHQLHFLLILLVEEKA